MKILNAINPAIAIYRLAVEESLTRDGGILKTATTGIEIEIAPGKKLRVAQTQDDVVYPDGSTAKIISGAGQAGHFANGRSIALVGSRLSNGDEIISTPQLSKPFIKVYLSRMISLLKRLPDGLQRTGQ